MTLSQQQIDEAGEALNDALRNGVISMELRTDLWLDVHRPTPGNAVLLAGARKVRQDSRTNPAYFSALDAYIAILAGVSSPAPAPTPVPVTPTPTPAPVVSPAGPVGAYRLPMRPLTNGEQRNAIDAMVRGGRVEAATTLELGFTKGYYPVVEAGPVEAAREAYWNDALAPADKDALRILLSAIDQRIPNGDGTFSPTLLPFGDPRIVPISGTLAAPGATSGSSSGSAYPPSDVPSDTFVMQNPETGFTSYITVSRNDDGLRIMHNYKFPWDNGAPSNPKLPQSTIFCERDGATSINSLPPQLDAFGNPTPKGPWDGLRGKDLAIYPNGFNTGGPKGQFVDIACMQAGRGIRLGASRNTADPQFHLEVTADEARFI